MIGEMYYKIMDSNFGEKYLDINITEEGLEWSEKGLARFMILNIGVFWVSVFSLFAYIGTFSNRMVISSIILTLYFKEKTVDMVSDIVKDHPKTVKYEENEDFREKTRYKILKDIIYEGEVIESIKRHTGQSEETEK